MPTPDALVERIVTRVSPSTTRPSGDFNRIRSGKLPDPSDSTVKRCVVS